MTNFIDTHSHLTFPPLVDNINEVIKQARDSGVVNIITVGTSPADSGKAIELAEGISGVFASVGIHPHEADKFPSADLLKSCLDSPKVVAIGETGLDYYYEHSTKENQKRLFVSHLELAVKVKLPVVIHCRDAFEDVLGILSDFKGRIKCCVFHCFSGGRTELEKILDMGWFVSLTGIITFKNAGNLRETVRYAGAENILVETDSPYISPEPVRAVQPNQPANVKYIVECLANLLNQPIEKLSEVLFENTLKVFGAINKESL